MNTLINEADKIEILTLQDNYIDLVPGDNTEIVQRAIYSSGWISSFFGGNTKNNRF